LLCGLGAVIISRACFLESPSRPVCFLPASRSARRISADRGADTLPETSSREEGKKTSPIGKTNRRSRIGVRGKYIWFPTQIKKSGLGAPSRFSAPSGCLLLISIKFFLSADDVRTFHFWREIKAPGKPPGRRHASPRIRLPVACRGPGGGGRTMGAGCRGLARNQCALCVRVRRLKNGTRHFTSCSPTRRKKHARALPRFVD